MFGSLLLLLALGPWQALSLSLSQLECDDNACSLNCKQYVWDLNDCYQDRGGTGSMMFLQCDGTNGVLYNAYTDDSCSGSGSRMQMDVGQCVFNSVVGYSFLNSCISMVSQNSTKGYPHKMTPSFPILAKPAPALPAPATSPPAPSPPVPSPTPGNDTFCSIMMPYLYSGCNCTDKKLGGRAECDVNLIGVDTVGLALDVEPCSQPANVDLEVTEKRFGIDYPIEGVTAGTEDDFPIPGLSISIPFTPINAGVDVSVAVNGDLDALAVKIGINACAEMAGFKVCGSNLFSELPVVVFNGTMNFGSACEGALARLRRETATAEVIV